MTKHHIFKHMPFSATDLSHLVWDVEQYPKFINFITGVRVLQKSDETMRAEVRVQYKVIRESFVTNVLRDPDHQGIQVSLARGPFRKLENQWHFHPLCDGSTLVEFKVSYVFSIPWLGRIFQNKQAKAEKMILAAFEARAVQCFNKIPVLPELSSKVEQEISALQVIQ